VAAASLIRRTTGALGVLLLAAQLGAPATVAACAGDCDGSGTVDVSELVKGVNIALGSLPVSACTAFDLNGNGLVSVNELVAAVNALLDGCPAVTATPIRSTAAIPTATETALPSSSPTAAPSATSTPTATVNLPPVLPTASIYRTYPGFDISLPIGATDPDGDSVQCVASDLPAGASFDAQAGVLSWTPKNDQLGPFYVPFSCTDDGQPPESAAGLITFRVSALDACTMPTCDPATGCTSTLPAPTQLCCAAGPAARVAEPVAGCPQGRVVYVGQNANPESFGRLQNCDVMQVINFQQSGAEVQFHVEARCVNTLNRVHLRARMETKDRLLFDAEVLPFFLEAGPGDFASQRDLRLSVGGGGPFFDLQGAEANFTFTMTDSDSVAVSNSVRVLLTFTPRPDLPDVDPTLAPTATITATPTGTPG
jgi:hypothetical protein